MIPLLAPLAAKSPIPDIPIVWIIVAIAVLRAIFGALKKTPGRRPLPPDPLGRREGEYPGGGDEEEDEEQDWTQEEKPEPPRRAPAPPPRPTTPRRPALPPTPAKRSSAFPSPRTAEDAHPYEHLAERGDSLRPIEHIHTTHEHLADLDRTRVKTVEHLGAGPASGPPRERPRARSGRALLTLPADASPRDRLRSAIAWSEILGSPRSRRWGARSYRTQR